MTSDIVFSRFEIKSTKVVHRKRKKEFKWLTALRKTESEFV